MILVQFYSLAAQKHVTISKHRALKNAIKAARKAYSEDGYGNVSILAQDQRLDRYGNEDSTIL